MFKSLLRTIPTISGNFTLACKVNNYITKNHTDYTSYIDDAILMPLDNKYSLDKNIQINLPNGKYEYDIMKYYKEMSSYFYNDTYQKNQNIFEQYSTSEINLPDNRDKNFEFGCKRISYNKYQYQFQFFAPIYINSVDDLPDAFVINIYSDNNILLKTINIPITSKVGTNKLRLYLTKYIQQIENNVPVVWNFGNDKIIYQKSIDCKNGGFINFQSYNTIQSNKVTQTIINDIDNLICQGYKNNGIIISECIPLSFIFNIHDIILENDLYYYDFNKFNISGYYVKNDIKCEYYDFSYNYHNTYNYYIDYKGDSNKSQKKLYNLYDNNIIYSLKEGTNYYLYYQNTFKKTYFQWKLNESNDYIINLNSVFSFNKITNKFPILKNSLSNKLNSIIDDSQLYIPINNYSNFYNSNDQTHYNFLVKNNYTNWFTIYTDNSLNDLSGYFPIYNNKVFVNGVDYKIDDDNIKYFNIFVNPIPVNYNKDIIKGDIIIKDDLENNDYQYINNSNEYYSPIEDTSSLSDDNIVYIKDNMVSKIYYLKYDEELFNDLANKIYNKLYNEPLLEESKYKIDKEWILKALSNNFEIVEGYLKLDIQTSMFDSQIELYNNFFKNNLTNKYKIFYSLNNTSEKNNLYFNLNNQQINYEFLLNNNITYFEKTKFIRIGDYKEFNNILFNDLVGLYTLLYKYYDIDQENNLNLLNRTIDKVKSILCKNDNGIDFDLYSSSLNLNEILQKSKELLDLSVSQNYVLGELNSVRYYYITYQILYQYITTYNVYQLYRYIPYNNQNNIIINHDYYDKIYNNSTYSNLYFNSNEIVNSSILSLNQYNTTICYVYIDSFETFEYFRKKYGKDYINKNIYNKETKVDNIDVNYNLYQFNLDYLTQLLYLNNIPLQDNEIVNKLSKNILNVTQLLYNKLSYNLNQGLIQFDIRYNNQETNKVEYKTIDLKVNLYLKLTCYQLNKELFDILEKTNKNNYVIYRELKENTYLDNSKVINCNIIYNNVSKFNSNSYTLQILKKNLDINHKKNMVYQDPYNILRQLSYQNYKRKYSNQTLYMKYDLINKCNIGFYKLNEQYGYIRIDYYLMNSTNAFDIYNLDDDDNFIIKKINNIDITSKSNQILETPIKSIFKNIYPYIKLDLFIELLHTKINGVQIILPNAIKCDINTIIKRKSDDTKFTNISLSKNIIKKIYLNRYFGNICPFFKKIDNNINYERSKIYIISDNKNTNVLSDNNNVFVETISLYQYNPIKYYNESLDQLYSISQYEFKHFNHNQLYNLPNEIILTPKDVDYIQLSQLKEYENEEKCFEYFKKYITSKNFLPKTFSNEKEIYFLFKKYSINYIYESDIVSNIISNPYKIYKISYKLILT